MPGRATLTVDDPFTGDTACELPLCTSQEAACMVDAAGEAQRAWAAVAVAERALLVRRFCDAFQQRRDEVARDISRTMGKPVAQARREVGTMCDRALHMASIAEETLADHPLPEKPGFRRFIAREPLGVVLDIAPWNYPLLTAVNVVVPAILAGNAVLLKPSSRTPLCGEHFARAFREAGAPPALCQSLFAGHDVVSQVMARPEVGYVAFTGGVAGGHEINLAAARRFTGVGLELGGKDPAWVAEDADLGHALENLADGAFYNAGQSCCGVKRIYVHERHYEAFAEGLAALARDQRPGDPAAEETVLGPLATPDAPEGLSRQVEDARRRGARVLAGGEQASVGGRGRFFLATVVAAPPHDSPVVQEESFGPVVTVTPARDDEEALALMNASRYGLTASVWTRSEKRAEAMGRRLETGTVYMNRCDYLDPALPWVGVKDSGLGCSLSHLGLLALTRPKSFHLRRR